MKLKKKPKMILIAIITVIAVVAIAFVAVTVAKKLGNDDKVEKVKVLKSIDAYGYHLKDNKDKKYKTMFEELEKILTEKEVSDDEYVKKITEMFIYDFYSLNDKTAKTDVGGVDFVLPAGLENFLVNAEDTYYKYVESNIYGERKQSLPMVDTITISSATETEYVYNGKKYNAYEVKATWTYTDEKFASYQNNATLIFVKEDIKYYLAELQ